MARVLLLFILSNSLFIPLTEAQELYSAKPIMGGYQEFVKASAVDSEGNLYVSFYTSGSLGPNQHVNVYDSMYQLTGGVYVAKFTPFGTVEWIKNYDNVTAIEVDPKNNSILLSGTLNQYSFLLTKINSAGDILWQTREGTSGGMYGVDIIIDAQGNSYVTGNALSWSVFGFVLNEDGCCPDHDFIAKFNSQGGLVWIRGSSPDSYTYGRKLAFDTEGNILMAGDYTYTMGMGSFSLSSNTNGYRNTYLASYKPDGSINWLKGFGGNTGHCYINDLEVDDQGSIYLGGSFNNRILVESTPLTAVGDFDLYLAKLSSAGSLVWVKNAGSPGREMVNDILKTSDGILFSGTVSGSIQIGTEMLSSITNRRSFICRFDNMGQTVWLKDFTDEPGEFDIDVSFQPHLTLHSIDNHNFYVVGGFSNSLITQRRTLVGNFWECFTARLSDYCAPVQDAGEDSIIHLCYDDSVRVTVEAPEMGYWTLISGGNPILTQLGTSDFLIDQLNPGETILQWNLEHCSDFSTREIRINRTILEQPTVDPVAPFCSELLGKIEVTAIGNNISWYLDNQLVFEGPSFSPNAFGTYYVTDQLNGCLGPSLPVIVAEKSRSETPQSLRIDMCLGDESEIMADGTDVKWYSDLTGGSTIHEGGSYSMHPLIPGQYTLYISQTLPDKCESFRTTAIVSVFAIPPPPTATSFELCSGVESILSMVGSNLAWYTSLQETTPVFTGASYKAYYETAGENTLYVTQTVNDCESEKVPVSATVQSFSMDDIFISNVVTPNNDGYNDAFYIPHFNSEECLGNFLRVRIYNRWGQEVFSSGNRDFIWRPAAISSGTYYYSITFSLGDFKGWISVL